MDDPEYEVTLHRHLADLAPAFKETRRKELEALNAAFAKGDDPELLRLAHMMKGVGTSYGVPRIEALGAELEQAIDRRDYEAIALHLLQYDEYLRRLRIKVEK